MGSSEKSRNDWSQSVPASEKKKMPYWLLTVCIAEAVAVAVLILLVVIPAHIPYPTSSDNDASAEKAIKGIIAQAEADADKPGSTEKELVQHYESALKESPDAIWSREIRRRIEKAKQKYEKRAQEALAKFNLTFESLLSQENYTAAESELGNFSVEFKDCEICGEQIAAMQQRLALSVEAREKCFEVIAAAEDLWRNERASEALQLLSSFSAKYPDTIYVARVKVKKDEIESHLARIAAEREAQERRRQEEAAREKEKREREELEKQRLIEEQAKHAEEERRKAEEEKRKAEEEARAKEEEAQPKEPQEEEGQPWTTVEMKPFSENEFPFITPFPADSSLAGGPQATATLRFLPLPNEGRKFGHAVQDNQSSIEIDTDADGKLDKRLPAQGGIVTVKVFYGKDEGEAPYTVQIFRVEGALRFRRHSFTAGKFQNIKLFLIDENNNGRFNDYGTDALSFGNNPCACTLGEVMMIGAKLFEVKVSQSGKKLSLRPFAAKTGKLNLVSGFKAKANLLYAIVLGKIKDEKGKEFTAAFDLAGQTKGANIPVGAYELHAAAVGSRNKLIAKIRKTDECKEITVTESSPVKIDWGAPARAQFSYNIDAAGKLRVRPETIQIYGAYGELYCDMEVNELLPNVQVKNENEVIIMTRSFNKSDDGKSLEIFESLVPTNMKLKVRLLGKIGFLGDFSSEWK